MFEVKKYNSVFSLINALEKRPLNGKNLKNVAIQAAFDEATSKGIPSIVEELHEHPIITSGVYASRLNASWTKGMNHVFSLLFTRMDKNDLIATKDVWCYQFDAHFRQTIDNALNTPAPSRTRHDRFFGRAKLVINTLDKVMKTGVWSQEPGKIIAVYLVGEQEWREERERMEPKKQGNETCKNKRKKGQKKQNQKKSKREKNAPWN